MSVIDHVKDIASLVKAIGNMDLYRQILDLQSEILDLTQEKRDIEARVQDIEEKLSFSKKIAFSSPFYFAEGDPIPYCPRCWEAERKAIHFPTPFNSAAGPRYNCPECKTVIVHPRR